MKTLFLPDLILGAEGRFQAGTGLLADESGKIVGIYRRSEISDCNVVELPGKALLPAFVNTHSHSFQRLIRGKAESRSVAGNNFWSWRETMYHAAASLDQDDLYDVARMAFLEMALAGTATVGEFHYLHRSQNGGPFEDANLLSLKVIEAARSVGIRIVLLRCAYQRSGYRLPANPGQARFLESTKEFLSNVNSLLKAFPAGSEMIRIGVAPHSIRAVPLDSLGEIVEWARSRKLPVHMHVAEQRDEVAACEREYGASPIVVLDREKLLGHDFTAVHGIHISPPEMHCLAAARATVCSCPTTERNLGDGVVSADELATRGIPIALGSDSEAQIDPLEDARELDYHLRLLREERAPLDQIARQDLATRLFECATENGARSLMVPSGRFEPGAAADFLTVKLSDPSIVGNSTDDLLSMIVFSLDRTAISDVAVTGSFVVRDHRHAKQEEIIARYQAVWRKVWPQSPVGVH